MAKEAAAKPPSQTDTSSDQPAKTIEDHFQVLEEAVTALESEDLSLEEALKRYETGLTAVRKAGVLLDSYRARLEELRIDP